MKILIIIKIPTIPNNQLSSNIIILFQHKLSVCLGSSSIALLKQSMASLYLDYSYNDLPIINQNKIIPYSKYFETIYFSSYKFNDLDYFGT